MPTWSQFQPRASNARLRTSIPPRYRRARSRVLTILARWDREVVRASAPRSDRAGYDSGCTTDA